MGGLRGLGPFCIPLLMAVPGAGCTKSSTKDDAGVVSIIDIGQMRPDAPGGPGIDTDEDGLCDETEVNWGTDYRNRDSDGDGFEDLIEIVYGYDAARPSSPAREEIATLYEDAGSTAEQGISHTVRGEGQDFQGAFEALRARDQLGHNAADFFVGSAAVFANPAENIGAMEEERSLFRGVMGRTELGFEVRFAFGAHMPRLCTRAYPFQHAIKRNDGTTVGVATGLLLVLPASGTLADSPWCGPTAPCM